MNDNQNGFVTRSTSRVLAEPGGKSSMGFLFSPKNTDAMPGTAKAKANEASPATGTAALSTRPEESAREAAARIKAKNESQHFSPFGGSPPRRHVTSRPEESASEAAARIKAKNEAQHLPVGFGRSPPRRHVTSSNAYASSSTTNSYNVITGRSTSRVVSFIARK